MTNNEALEIIEPTIKVYETLAAMDGDTSGNEYVQAVKKSVSAMRKLSYLTGRPCEVCSCHSENGCSAWECAFDEKES